MILFRKAVRAIWSNKKAYLSCVLLVTIAIFMMISMGSASDALGEAAAAYYKSNRLADVFASVNNFPGSMISSLEQIKGIDEVQARLVYDARVLMPGNSKIIWLRLISYDISYDGTPLNAPNVTGRPLTGVNDIWIGRSFMDTHRLEAGGALTVIAEGREVTLNIKGFADSPEYVFTVRNPTEFYADNEAFGIAYVNLHDLGVLLNKAGSFNDLAFSLGNGYTFDDVKEGLSSILAAYGLNALYAKEDQFSHRMLKVEVRQVKALSYAFPLVFAAISAIILFLTLKRVIEQERTQIGVLKSFGFMNHEIITHYIMYGLAVSLIGGVLGVFLGNSAIGPLINMYTRFFVLPGIRTTVEAGLAGTGMAMAGASGLIGAYLGAKPSLELSPADAMRPPAPPPVKGDIIKTLPILSLLLSSKVMSVRNIQRNKTRSVFITLCIAFSFGMLAMVCPMTNMMSDMVLSKYEHIQAYDAKLTLILPAPVFDVVRQALKLPGVTTAEPLREIPAEIRLSNRKEGVVLTGIKPGAMLYHIYDDLKMINLSLPDTGIILNSFTADSLGAGKGSRVYIKTAYNRDEIPVIVRDTVHQNLSLASYMNYNAINQMLGLADSADSVMVRTADMEGLKTSLNETKNISAIEDTYSSAVNFNQQMNAYSSMIWVIVILDVLIAFAIIQNSVVISFSEKKREYATLRVLGMQVDEVCEISNFEYWLLFTCGCALGIPFGQFLLNLMNILIGNYMENFSLPGQIPLWGHGMAFVGCMSAVVLSNMSAGRVIKRMDLAEALKEKV